MKKRLFSFVTLSLALFLFAGVLYAATFTGTWTLYYDWSCDGGYGQSSITLNSNGTFTGSSGGTWTSVESGIIWEYSATTNAKYYGTKIGGAMSGIMKTTTGLKGCWYAVKSTSTSSITPLSDTKELFEYKDELNEAGE